MPFISVVTAAVKWTSVGGGGWQLRGNNISELSKSKILLPDFPKKASGVIAIQIPSPDDMLEGQEFRLFASANGRQYGMDPRSETCDKTSIDSEIFKFN